MGFPICQLAGFPTIINVFAYAANAMGRGTAKVANLK
jgi:hypothetical protein